MHILPTATAVAGMVKRPVLSVVRAIFSPCPHSMVPSDSMKVDLPTPGVPDRPIRNACRP